MQEPLAKQERKTHSADKDAKTAHFYDGRDNYLTNSSKDPRTAKTSDPNKARPTFRARSYGYSSSTKISVPPRRCAQYSTGLPLKRNLGG
jgi:hypothetical protein